MYKVFVDGSEGTTGLKINEYLYNRDDIEILSIELENRKDIEVRRILLNEADIVFLCLPDDSAKESVSLINNPKTRIIDASTAHRTNINWTYGLPELNKKQRDEIKNSNRVVVPGCHATGFITPLYPLVSQGIVPKEYPITAYSISGYSGGGKKLIKWYEDNHFSNMNSPKPYRFDLNHKHLPEMQKIAGLTYEPAFTPMISNYCKGMSVSIPLFTRLLSKKYIVSDIHEILSEYYASEDFINVLPLDIENSLEDGYLDVEANNDTNRIDILVSGNENEILLTSRLDNLGKGACGAAIQNMNLMLGLEEKISLRVY
jgi:N-acetyl-gamma-glutamyl-phosphate reductase